MTHIHLLISSLSLLSAVQTMVAQGVYNYKCEFENCDAVIGKLTIVE